MIDAKFIEQLKSKNDIVDVVSAYCSLERRGGSYWARCPLPGHMEKTPSFSVNAAGQFFKCFGCGRGGDVIKFIMEIENLNYVEAIRFLAARAGLEMPEDDFVDEKARDEKIKKKETSLAILKEAARFYVGALQTDEGREYLDYFHRRGFDDKIIRAFGLGCSPDYHSLIGYLKEKGYTPEEMLEAGVISYNEERGDYFDFEGKRAIIPIIDGMNNVVAFVGRVLTQKADFMKYKNTSDTAVFQKGRCVFNANNLKKLKRELGTIPYIVMVEGQIDVISVYAAGIKNVAASMGTSLTAEQAKIIMRYTDTVVISYDGDAAGQKATFRGLEIFKDAGLTVKVATLPKGLDPDEMIKQMGVEAYRKILDEALPLIDYKLKIVREAFDEKTVDGKRKIVENSLKVIAESDKDFEREELLKRLSSYTKLTYESLKRDLENGTTDSLKAVSVPVKEGEKDKPITALDASIVKAERFVLSSAINQKSFFKREDLDEIEFTGERSGVCAYLTDKLDEGVKIFAGTLLDRLGDSYLTEINGILSVGDAVTAAAEENYYFDCVKFLKKNRIEGEIRDLQEYFSIETDTEKRRQIAENLQKKLKLLEKLKTEDKK